jgi:hypothetical protein
MMRSLVVASAIALTFLPPAIAVGAPTAAVRGGPIVQPPPPRSLQARSASQEFKVPFHVDLHPRTAEPDMQTFLPYRWHALQYSPQYLWNQPAWNQNGCFANNLFGAPSTLQGDGLVPGTTIGSLVDGRSKSLLSSTPSYNPNLPPGGEGVVTLQPTSCGSANVINF